jgi:hypothetical protein
MTEKTFSGDTITRTFTFKDETDALFDPDTIAILILDPLGATVATLAIGDLTRSSLGVFKMVYTLPAGCAVGNWNIQVTATYGGLANEEFFPFAVEAVPAAPYAVADAVKAILVIADSEGSKYDIELAGCMQSSNGLVDSFLLKRGLAVPSPIPQNIVDASNHYAAWLFRHRRDPTGAEAFWSEAEKFLNAYCESQLDTCSPFAIGEDTS